MDKGIYRTISEILLKLGLIKPGEDIQGLKLICPGGVMDSLTAIRFISEVENSFGINVLNDLNLDCMESVESLAAYIMDEDSGE